MALATSTEARRAYWSLGDLWIVHLSGEETEGCFSLLETVWAPASPAPLHVHRATHELYYVFEGELTCSCRAAPSAGAPVAGCSARAACRTPTT
jgi:mannose-6-phosphate isomerase-like protein (cupin superfamily)